MYILRIFYNGELDREEYFYSRSTIISKFQQWAYSIFDVTVEYNSKIVAESHRINNVNVVECNI